MIKCSAFLIDLDGTLVDSYRDAEVCWRDWARSVGAINHFDFTKLFGRRRAEIILTVLPGLPAEEVRKHSEYVRLSEGKFTDNVTALPGSAQLLEMLPKSSWAIVTSNDREVAKARVRAAGLPMPDVLLTEDEVERGKPDPEGLLLAAEKLNTNPSNCLAIDDSPVGIEAAYRAGMPSIAVRYRYGDSALHRANLIVDSLSSLLVTKVRDGFEVSKHE
ncbi:MAG TPA: HAD-IA family hydrolase [Streptosporangiaceae bacterium]|nr:HAD-IA family hydrolase [Streptosporangiaceae bacterium]